VHYADFPPSMRALLIGTAALFSLNVILFGIGITAVVALLSDNGIHPSGWTLMGVLLGAGGTFIVTRRIARENRLMESNDIAVSLHAEIADRAARCLNDYLAPWSKFEQPDYDQEAVPEFSWVGKFRPVDPVVYPAVASKLGLLKPDALFAVVQFYFRLRAVQREIDGILSDQKFAEEKEFKKVRRRLVLVARRFHATLEPASLALFKLSSGFDGSHVEAAAIEAYGYVREKRKPLREQLQVTSIR
jgi:hypothetical protein